MSVDPASLAVKAVVYGASMAMTMSQKFEGPKLDTLKVSTAEVGTAIERVWGRKWVALKIVWAADLHHKKVTSKTKGGKYAEHRYSADFIGLAVDQTTDAISKLKMDNHLVYDATKVGPIAALGGIFSGLGNSPVKLTRGRNMRLYNGAQTEPDPMMDAWCEERFGADSAPAWPGQTFAAFQKLPLEKFGNRVPTTMAEVVRNKSTAYLFETLIQSGGLLRAMSKDGSRMLFHASNSSRTFAIVDIPTRTTIMAGTLANETERSDIASDGTIWGLGGTLGDTLWGYSESGAVKVEVNLGTFNDDVYCVGGEIYMTPAASFYSHIVHYSGAGPDVDVIDTTFIPYRYFEDLDGDAWAISVDASTLILYHIASGAQHDIATPGGVGDQPAAIVNPDGNFFVIMGTTVFTVDRTSMAVLESAVIPGLNTEVYDAAKYTIPGAAYFWANEKEINTVTLEVIRSVNLGDWTTQNTSQTWYLPVLHALLGKSLADTGYTIRYLDRVANNPPTLADVVDEISGWVGISDLDVSTLDQPIDGYLISQGTAKDALDPLMKIHDVVARPHDFGVEFIKRGLASKAAIVTGEFAREGDEPRFTLPRKQDTDLPQRLTITFADKDKDQQTNSVTSKRFADAVDTSRVMSIDAGQYVAAVGDMQKYGDRYFRGLWNRREEPRMAVTAQHSALEPGDALDLMFDQLERRCSIVKMTFRGLTRIDLELERDGQSLANLGSGEGADMDGRDEEGIYVPSPTKAWVMDLPLLDDSQSVGDIPSLTYAAGKYAGDWPGADIWTGHFDNDEYVQWNSVEAAEAAVWGYAEDALIDANPCQWDRGGAIVVLLKGGTLTNATEAEIQADPTINQALLGIQGRFEVINFTTATLLGSDRWQISGFLRGRRGTEMHCGSHAAGDEFILAASLKRDSYGLSDVGTTDLFKGQTLGRDPTSAPTIETDLDGASLMPRAPIVWHVAKDAGSGDITIELRSRTRLGGAWNGSTISTGETVESYEFDVYRGGVFKRTLTSSTKTLTYSVADQTTDGGSIAAEALDGNAYQLSASVGRGFARAA